jgi:hypothetical protein
MVIRPRLVDPILVVFVLTWSVVVGGLIAAVAWTVSSLPFLPVFSVATGVLLTWSVASSIRNLRRFLRDQPGGGSSGGWQDARGTREPRRPIGPRPASSTAADPEESTGPSTVF